MNFVGATAAVWGLTLLWRRWPAGREHPVALPRDGAWPRVSIVVPARNESARLPDLLCSLQALDYPDFEVIVVDDCSSDDTGAVAATCGGAKTRVVAGVARPDGWRGKQWACEQGAGVARGEFLLFTDADTAHAPDSLRRSVSAIVAAKTGLLTSLPFHRGTSWWERLSGPFHVLMLTVTAPFAPSRPDRVFAIGQYLLFTRGGYERVGRHAEVKDQLVEDLPLAFAALAAGIGHTVLAPYAPLFTVRMYDSPREFLAGWRRNVRAGLGMSPRFAALEITAMVAALAGAGGLPHSPAGDLVALAAFLMVARAQRRLGNFSALGALFWPLGVGALSLVTLLAIFDAVAGRPVLWKGRSYPSAPQR